MKECLDVLLNEEWWHRQFAERDLVALEHRQHQRIPHEHRQPDHPQPDHPQQEGT